MFLCWAYCSVINQSQVNTLYKFLILCEQKSKCLNSEYFCIFLSILACNEWLILSGHEEQDLYASVYVLNSLSWK